MPMGEQSCFKILMLKLLLEAILRLLPGISVPVFCSRYEMIGTALESNFEDG